MSFYSAPAHIKSQGFLSMVYQYIHHLLTPLYPTHITHLPHTYTNHIQRIALVPLYHKAFSTKMHVTSHCIIKSLIYNPYETSRLTGLCRDTHTHTHSGLIIIFRGKSKGLGRMGIFFLCVTQEMRLVCLSECQMLYIIQLVRG